MKKTIVGILLIFCTIALSADAYQSFSKIVNFKVTIKDLLENPSSIDPAQLYLLDGTISSIHLIKSDEGNFHAELEFMNSEWVGTDYIKTYRITLIMSKPGFANLFPEKAGQKPGPGQIGPNMRALVLVQFQNSNPGVAGEIKKSFIVHEFRILR